MKESFFFLIFTALVCFESLAQQTDAIVQARGKIYNPSTKESVTAKITYQSLPYGNIVGVLSGSEYSFQMFGNTKYSIEVEAPGFAPSKYMLDPATANAERIVIQDIELGLPGSASAEAPVAHHVGKVMRLEALNFQQRSSIISPESYAELNTVSDMLHSNPQMVIQLEGHTDTRGDVKLNLKLSEQRVDAVRDYLIRRGVSKIRIKLKAFGGSQPLSRENTEEVHKLNRRVEVRIVDN